MLVADTSALRSLATGDALDLLCSEYDVHTTATVVAELDETGGYGDAHAEAAESVLDVRDRMTVHETSEPGFESSRVDAGEATCVLLVRDSDADFLLTDDLRALPELENLVDARVAISPVVLRALVKRGVLDRADAESRLEQIAETRDWLGAPIYRRARQLFEDD